MPERPNGDSGKNGYRGGHGSIYTTRPRVRIPPEIFMTDEQKLRLTDIRRRNAYRLEKRALNKHAGLIQPFSNRASAIDDIEALLEIIDGQRETFERELRECCLRITARPRRVRKAKLNVKRR